MSALVSDAPDGGAAAPELARSTLEARLDQLRAEHDNGCQQLARLDRQRDELASTLERIEGAITVLHELLAPSGLVPAPGPA